MTTCLIVDDSNVTRKLIRKIVTGFNFDVDEAENGIIALEKCRASPPNLVLLDWNMPDMNGLEFLKQLRSDPSFSQIKIIMCTTENEIEKIQEALESGADEFIMKPFDADLIKDKLLQTGIISA
jgi:two-component system chemotaxis response regulator CheY